MLAPFARSALLLQARRLCPPIYGTRHQQPAHKLPLDDQANTPRWRMRSRSPQNLLSRSVNQIAKISYAYSLPAMSLTTSMTRCDKPRASTGDLSQKRCGHFWNRPWSLPRNSNRAGNFFAGQNACARKRRFLPNPFPQLSRCKGRTEDDKSSGHRCCESEKLANALAARLPVKWLGSLS